MAKALFHSWLALRSASRGKKDAVSNGASSDGNGKGIVTQSMQETNAPHKAFAVEGLNTGGDDVAKLRELILERLISTTGKDRSSASSRDWFLATALVVRDRIIKSWIASKKANYDQNRRRVYYLSLEFLIGRLLMDALNNLGMTTQI